MRKTKEYKYGSTKRDVFESTIVNMKVFMQALCRAIAIKKRLRIVIEYDPQSEDVKTTIQVGNDDQLELDQCEADPIWRQADPTQLDKREDNQKRQSS